MKYMLIIASVVALALAGPTQHDLVNPGATGPAPLPEPEPIAGGPAILDFQPTPVRPVPGDYVPVGVAPTPVFPDQGIIAPVAPIAPAPVPIISALIRISVNINAAAQFPGIVPPALPVAPAPSQPIIIPQPIVIDGPVAPSPKSAPEPVIIGTPVLPSPAVVLPEELN